MTTNSRLNVGNPSFRRLFGSTFVFRSLNALRTRRNSFRSRRKCRVRRVSSSTAVATVIRFLFDPMRSAIKLPL